MKVWVALLIFLSVFPQFPPALHRNRPGSPPLIQITIQERCPVFHAHASVQMITLDYFTLGFVKEEVLEREFPLITKKCTFNEAKTFQRKSPTLLPLNHPPVPKLGQLGNA